MPRETIASVKKASTLKLRQQGNAFALKLEVRERDHLDAIKVRDDHIHSLIRRNDERAKEIAAREDRIAELLKANNDYLQEGRDARAMVVRLQANLSDAARIIGTLGERAES